MLKRPSPAGPLLVDTLRDVLSPQAIHRLEQLGVRRDLGQTCSEEELRAALLRRGLPIYETVIDFERRCGGIYWPVKTYGTLDRLGVWAALLDLEAPGRISPPELSIECQGERLLPISAGWGGCDFWMSEQGTIFLCDEYDWGQTADSYLSFLEREALKWGYSEHPGILLHWHQLPIMTEEDFLQLAWWQQNQDHEEDEPSPAYDQDPHAYLDRRLAEAIGLPLFEPATDRWRHVWLDGSRLLFPRFPWRDSERLLRANDMDELLRIVQLAQEMRPTVLATWRGPRGDAPKPGEPVAARIQAYQIGRGVYGEILFIGTPGNYRAHEIEYEQPIWTGELWHERREAWKAARSRASGDSSHE